MSLNLFRLRVGSLCGVSIPGDSRVGILCGGSILGDRITASGSEVRGSEVGGGRGRQIAGGGRDALLGGLDLRHLPERERAV